MNKGLNRGIRFAAAAAALTTAGLAAHGTILTWQIPLGNGGVISQNYGDNVAANSMGIFTYAMGDGFTPNVTTSYTPVGDLRYWNSGYGDLLGAAYTQNGTTIEITLTAEEGFEVELRGFDLAGFQVDRPLALLEVRDSANMALLSQTNLTIEGLVTQPPRRSVFTFDPPLTSDVIVIRMSDPALLNVAIDNIHFTQAESMMKTPCPSDSTGDGVVNAADLGSLLNDWGPNPGSPSDITGDGVVNASDLGSLLNDWGPCPE
ncbi:MAG: dockerin type I domain-containing protein [Planctomycetota bacterium]|nr:dockerin type I domain-containing protein [Planctomycetota bacterium]